MSILNKNTIIYYVNIMIVRTLWEFIIVQKLIMYVKSYNIFYLFIHLKI